MKVHSNTHGYHSECFDCPSGYFSNPDTDAKTCTGCPTGFWQRGARNGHVAKVESVQKGVESADTCRKECAEKTSECLVSTFYRSNLSCIHLEEARYAEETVAERVQNSPLGLSTCNSCQRGEVVSESADGYGCEPCSTSSLIPGVEVSDSSRGYYSWYPSRGKCEVCPLGTLCSGGDKIITAWGLSLIHI